MADVSPPTASAGGGLKGIRATLSGKMFGVPTYVWLLVLIALAAFVLYRRRKAKAAAPAAATASSGAQTPADYGYLIGVETGTPYPGAQGPPGATGPVGAAGNPGSPASPPGTPPPPTPTPTPTPTPAPAPAPPPPAPVAPPPPPPPAQRTFTVQRWPALGSTLSGIAQIMYGNAGLWPRIYDANRAKIGNNPNLIYAGTVLVIP
jgi:nucleoid-associated protein YgaU